MRRPSTPWRIAVAVALLAAVFLAGCPARRTSPADLDPTFLDRA